MFNFRKKKQSNKLAIILSIIVGLFILLFYSLWTLRYVVWQLDELGDVVVSMAADFSTTNIELQSERLVVSIAIIDDMRDQLNKLRFVRILPVVRGTYYDLHDVFDQTEQIFFDLVKLNDELGSVYQAGFNDENITPWLFNANVDEINQRVESVSLILASLKDNFVSLSSSVNRLASSFLLRQQRGNLNQLVNGIDQLALAIDKINQIINIGPTLLGFPEPTTYLLLLQNNHEMRATGGFIGSYGIITMDHGNVKNLFIDDIYHLDSEVIGELEIDPPAPIRKYLNVQYWYMRDSNWSPDFPTAAAKAIEFYELEGGQEILDGVIAISPNVVSDLLDIVGEMLIANVLYEPDNFINILQYEVEQNYESRGVTHWDRKEVIGELANMLAQEVSSLPLEKMFAVVGSIYDNLADKDLQLYSLDSKVQSYLMSKNWAGELRQSDKDFLMVVDSNMAAYKTNQHISRSIDYFVQKIKNPVGEDYFVATTKIHYDHAGDFAWDTTRYRTYTRIYVPQGSILTSWSGAMADDRTTEPGIIDIYQEKDKTVFGTFISIEPGESGELIFQYRLPDFVVANYKLLYQHQSGMDDNLKVKFFNKKSLDLDVTSDIELKP